MFDRFSQSVRYLLSGLAVGAVLITVGLAGEALVTATPVPFAIAVPFRWLGQLGAALLLGIGIAILLKIAWEVA